jgi:RNA polymerase primary sigma factor
MRAITKQTERSITRGNLNLERYLKQIEKYELVKKDDEKAIIRLAQQGNQQARDQLVLGNIKFVVTCAKQYQAPNIEILDLINAGNIGLINAIDKYDIDKSTVKFYSYAVWWIKQAMISYLKDHARNIKIPYNQLDAISRLTKKRDELEKELETELSLIDVLDLDENNADDKTLIKQALDSYSYTLSLDSPVNEREEDEFILGETLPAENTFETNLEKEHLSLYINKVLEKLPPVQQKVIKLSYGFEDGICYTNDDIAIILKVTSERIRQIKNKALTKLKQSKILKKCLL